MTTGQPPAHTHSGDEPADREPHARFAVGIGCRRGVSPEQIEAAVLAALGARPICAVRCVATLDAKAGEPGLLAFCARYRLPLVTFGAKAAGACADAHGLPASSAAARLHVGAVAVCEPCALLAAPGGTLVVRKQVHEGVTVAVAAWPVARATGSAIQPTHFKDFSA